MRPSFLATGLSATLAVVATVLFLNEYMNTTISRIDMIKILLLISIAFGVHSLSHYNEEVHYGFNPMIGQWKINDIPIR